VGDHAVNIGERVIYMVTGWLPESNAAARARLKAETELAEPNSGSVADDSAGEGDDAGTPGEEPGEPS
jgi:phosphate transport system protein